MGALPENRYTFFKSYTILLEWEMFQTEVVDEIKCTYCSLNATLSLLPAWYTNLQEIYKKSVYQIGNNKKGMPWCTANHIKIYTECNSGIFQKFPNLC